jgi:hypothetical protein
MDTRPLKTGLALNLQSLCTRRFKCRQTILIRYYRTGPRPALLKVVVHLSHLQSICTKLLIQSRSAMHHGKPLNYATQALSTTPVLNGSVNHTIFMHETRTLLPRTCSVARNFETKSTTLHLRSMISKIKEHGPTSCPELGCGNSRYVPIISIIWRTK